TFGAFFAVGIAARVNRGFEEGDRPGGRVSPGVLRADVLQHRADDERPPALGRGAGPARPGVRGEPVRVRDLDRAGDLVALLPRGSGRGGQVKWKRPTVRRPTPTPPGNWPGSRRNRCCRPRGG